MDLSMNGRKWGISHQNRAKIVQYRAEAISVFLVFDDVSVI